MLSLAEVRARESAERCHLCGLPKSVCRDGAMADGAVKTELERCHVATAVASAREVAERDGMPHVSAVEVIPSMPDPASGLGL